MPTTALRYVALSYVWGPPDIPQLQLNSQNEYILIQDGWISTHWDHVPSTIADAITLCRSLDERYLWVDAICIKQDDEKDKLTQIGAMDKIYASACFTIASTHGSDSWAGLPGIGRTPRKTTQHVETVDDIPLGLKQPILQTVLKQCIWNQRAWTMQEKLLSRRILYFTQHQTFYACTLAHWVEDMIKERLYHDVHAYSLLLSERNDYYRIAEDFSARKTTSSMDMINAFTGIMHSLSTKFGWTFFWGLPHSLFTRALYFHVSSETERRSEFPSWSWLGWNFGQSSNLSNNLYSTRFMPDNLYAEVLWYQVSSNVPIQISDSKVPGYPREDIDDSGSRIRITELLSPLLPYLSSSEQSKLLVFDGFVVGVLNEEITFDKVDLGSDTSTTGEDLSQVPWSTSVQPLNLNRASLGPYSFRRLRRPSARSTHVILHTNAYASETLELVAFCRNSRDSLHTQRKFICVVGIRTDHRGVSERVPGIDECYFTDEKWARLKPTRRTVFLM